MEKTARKVNEQFPESEAFYSELEEEDKNTDITSLHELITLSGKQSKLKGTLISLRELS